jgi:hypothetical protein
LRSRVRNRIVHGEFNDRPKTVPDCASGSWVR